MHLTIKSQQNPEDRVLISVSDSGIGLPPERADKVFDAFFTTKPQGTGMGLSISRSIVESHGGRLWATGNPDKGATFQFTLPVETCRDCNGIDITSVLQDPLQKCRPCEVGETNETKSSTEAIAILDIQKS